MAARRARTSAEWKSRRGLAWALRAGTIIAPLAAATVAMIAVAHLVARPHGWVPALTWYGLLLAVSWAASRLVSRVVDRSLPLAALLEMSLTFPESAPSRLGLVQRDSSAAMLARLAVAPPDESAQAAAERILKLLTALSRHDRWTRGHAERVRAYADLIAERMKLSDADRDRLSWAALLHDIGKLQVPAALLNKTAKPTPGEWDVLKQHPAIGSVIAAPLLSWLAPMERVIAEHHERWDGSGYPQGLAGEAISFGARIVCVADSFEAMTAVRPYSKPKRRDAALRELVECAGSHFDPSVVRALVAVPQRRLSWVMGPAAWLGGLPWLGQGSVAAARTAASHGVSAAVGASAVVVAAAAPVSLLGLPVSAGDALAAPAPASSTAPAKVPAPATPRPTGTHAGPKSVRTTTAGPRRPGSSGSSSPATTHSAAPRPAGPRPTPAPTKPAGHTPAPAATTTAAPALPLVPTGQPSPTGPTAPTAPTRPGKTPKPANPPKPTPAPKPSKPPKGPKAPAPTKQPKPGKPKPVKTPKAAPTPVQPPGPSTPAKPAKPPKTPQPGSSAKATPVPKPPPPAGPAPGSGAGGAPPVTAPPTPAAEPTKPGKPSKDPQPGKPDKPGKPGHP